MAHCPCTALSISELSLSTPHVCSLKEGLIVLGILLGYLTGYLFVEDIGGWRSMYGIAAVPALLAGLGMVRFWAAPTHSLMSMLAVGLSAA